MGPLAVVAANKSLLEENVGCGVRGVDWVEGVFGNVSTGMETLIDTMDDKMDETIAA